MGTKLTVKCIESYPGVLTEGKVYELVSETPSFYRVTGDNDVLSGMYKDRFEKPKETITYQVGDRVVLLNSGGYGPSRVYKEGATGVVMSVVEADQGVVGVRVDGPENAPILNFYTENHMRPEVRLIEETVEEPVGEVDFECSPPAVTRQSVLEEAARLITGDRKADYGDAKSMHQLIGDLWTAYLNGLPQPADGSREPLRAEQVAMMMALMKIARSTSSPKFDTYVDLAGYSALAGEMATQG